MELKRISKSLTNAFFRQNWQDLERSQTVLFKPWIFFMNGSWSDMGNWILKFTKVGQYCWIKAIL